MVTLTINITRPVVGLTDTIDAATYNASGVSSLTGEITGALPADGSEPLTGDLVVTGTLTAGSIVLTGAGITAGAVTASGAVTTGALTATGLITANGGAKIGALGTTLTSLKSGAGTVSVPSGAVDAEHTVGPLAMPGATAAGIRYITEQGATSAYFSIKSSTVDGSDNVTLTLVRLLASGGSQTFAYSWLFV